MRSRRPSTVVVWRRAAILVLCASIAFEGSSSAQSDSADGEDPWAGVEEMLVTGRGAALTATDAAVSVVAFDEEHITAIGAQDLSDIAAFTPNLEIRSPLGPASPTLFIRGVGLRDFSANSSSAVAVYNDDVYMASPAGQLSQLFDTQAVEVLRGPQGAIYGRNASAGVIRVVGRRPSGEFGGYTRMSYGRFNSIEVEGAAEAPILGDVLSVRIAGRMNLQDGQTKNRCADVASWGNAVNRTISGAPLDDPEYRTFIQCFNGDTTADPSQGGQAWFAGPQTRGNPNRPIRDGRAQDDASNAIKPPGLEKWVNNTDNWAARAIFLLKPDEGIEIALNVHGGKNRALARQNQAIGTRLNTTVSGIIDREVTLGLQIGSYIDVDNQLLQGGLLRSQQSALAGDAYEGDYNRTGLEKIDLFGTNVVAEIESDDGSYRLKSVTAYEWNERATESNLDATPLIGFEPIFGNEAWQVSEDLRLYIDEGNGHAWQFGGNFLYENLQVENKLRFTRTLTTDQTYDQETFYGSFYAYYVWEPSEVFSIEGGARWNFERKTFDLSAFSQRITNNAPQIGFITANDRVHEDAPTGDVSLNYRPTEEFTAYLKFSRGWKGPAFNGLATTDPQNDSFDPLEPVAPESVDSIEAGIKSTWFAESVRFDLAAFFYSYQDLQIFSIQNAPGQLPTPVLINANDATLYGVEFELDARPFESLEVSPYLERLTFFASFGWLQGTYSNFIQSTTTQPFDDGTPVQRQEDFSGNRLINSPEFAFAGYVSWPLMIDGIGLVTPRFDWTFKSDVFFSTREEDFVGQEGFWLFNVRLDYQTLAENLTVSGWVRNVADKQYVVDVIDLTNIRSQIAYAIGDPRTYGVTVAYQF